MMMFEKLKNARSGLAALMASRAVSRSLFLEFLPAMQSVRCLSGVTEPSAESERVMIGPADPASPDVNASMRSKRFGGYLYTATQYEFYRPPEWKQDISIVDMWEWQISNLNSGSTAWLKPGELPRRELEGAHTFFAIFGFDELTHEFYQLLMQRIKLPEAAVFAVEDDKEAEHVGGLLSSGRVWPSHGFTVLPVDHLDYWPEGDPPKSYQVEFPTLAVPGRWMEPQCGVCGGWYNEVEQRKNYRGVMGMRRVGYCTLYKHASFWRGFAAGSLNKGSEWYKKMKIAAGVRAGKVVVLESRQQVLEEAEKAAEEFQGWMDPQVAVALKERDDILREHGYPDVPDEVKTWIVWKDYQEGAVLNPLVFARLESLQGLVTGIGAGGWVPVRL